MSVGQEDAALPAYRTGYRSFMQFQDLPFSSRYDDLPDDTSIIPRLRDDGGIPPHILETHTDDKGLTSNDMIDESLQDQEAYEANQIPDMPENLPNGNQPLKCRRGSRGSMQRLTETVQRVFDLPGEVSLFKHYPAWLLKSVMLQGQIYLTTNHLCFYAYMPSCDDITIKSGYLVKKSRTSNRHHRRWCILKNNVLSYYENASDLYFPSGNIDLRDALSVTIDADQSSELGFGLTLSTRTQEYHFRTETASNLRDWVKIIKKVIFRLNNKGESVKIAIPLVSIFDVDSSAVLDFTDTMRIRIADDNDTFAINEYLFSLFGSADEIIDSVKRNVKRVQTRSIGSISSLENVSRTAIKYDTSEEAPGYQRMEVSGLIAEHQNRNPDTPANIELIAQDIVAERKRSQSILSANNPFRRRSRSRSTNRDLTEFNTESSMNVPVESTDRASNSVTRILGSSLKTVGNIATSALSLPGNILLGSHTSVQNTDTAAEDAISSDVFHKQFGLVADERLLRAFKPYYVHHVPIVGDLYISDERICYRSSTPGTKIRIVLPLHDVERAKNEHGFSFGLSGIVISVRAHEDIFFEFSHSRDRDQCVEFINGAISNLSAKADRKAAKREVANRQAAIQREEYHDLEHALKSAGGLVDAKLPDLENVVALPPIIFDSPSTSMLGFKPAKQLRFTCLTIGSRGDVQPYVALCKGLIADGQRAKIATHEEFREFVESHGIEFEPIEGNPAELMSICVEHGMFTYGFLKEASQKFRPWIDALLKSSWTACQNTDVLIESPSAMGGIHIAEALGVPYFRAFTMPWTKTRVYPHAFAVPDHNMGGNYNALTYAAFDNLFWKAISGQINRWRRKTLNLPSTTYDKLAQYKVPFLYNFSPSVVPPARDWHEWIRVTGYWFLDGSDDKKDQEWQPPAAVVKFIEHARSRQKHLVYIGFGSIVVSDPKALTRAVVDAVKQADVQCILVKGWSGRSSKKEDDSDSDNENAEPGKKVGGDSESQPDTDDDADVDQNFGDSILSLDAIPHDWLFPQVDVACHHGGAGSLGASLRAGVPTIVKPFFGDQHFFGGRVQDLGVGLCLHSLTTKTLSEALTTCCKDTLIKQKAHKIGDQIRSERGVDNAIENIYRDLEYAKSLIKNSTRTLSAGGSESSNESYEHIERPSAQSQSEDEADDPDLFETKTDSNGLTSTILKPFKNLKLPGPKGDKSGSYGLSGLKLFKSKNSS